MILLIVPLLDTINNNSAKTTQEEAKRLNTGQILQRSRNIGDMVVCIYMFLKHTFDGNFIRNE